jgi:hypothetical protein
MPLPPRTPRGPLPGVRPPNVTIHQSPKRKRGGIGERHPDHASLPAAPLTRNSRCSVELSGSAQAGHLLSVTQASDDEITPLCRSASPVAPGKAVTLPNPARTRADRSCHDRPPPGRRERVSRTSPRPSVAV